MTQEKLRKIIVACVVATTLLLVLLLGVLVYQWIKIGVLNSRIDQIEQENAKLEETIAAGTKDAEYYESVMGKEWLAFQNGFVRPD
ncbi:MAG: hypothetical protein IJW60_02585 [Clostridia bacterium]|nr:hypothetical protein [Clostridia bacterium]